MTNKTIITPNTKVSVLLEKNKKAKECDLLPGYPNLAIPNATGVHKLCLEVLGTDYEDKYDITLSCRHVYPLAILVKDAKTLKLIGFFRPDQNNDLEYVKSSICN